MPDRPPVARPRRCRQRFTPPAPRFLICAAASTAARPRTPSPTSKRSLERPQSRWPTLGRCSPSKARGESRSGPETCSRASWRARPTTASISSLCWSPPTRRARCAPPSWRRLVVHGRRAGTLITFYRAAGRPSQAELRVVQEAASLVAAQVELSVLAEQEKRLSQAELRALRAQISPHFIYNALAAVAGEIHARPEEARDLLIDFAQFTRYLFRDGRSYVTLGEEIEHVERYLRLERARFPRPRSDDRRAGRGAERRRAGDVDPAARRKRRSPRRRAPGGFRTGDDHRRGSGRRRRASGDRRRRRD